MDSLIGAPIGDLPAWLALGLASGFAVGLVLWFVARALGLPRIDILKGVDPKDLQAAQEAARGSEKPLLPALPFTEGNFHWTLLYDHARRGQVRPETLRHMRRADVEFLAGMSYPHPYFLAETDDDGKPLANNERALRWHELTKLQGNAARANAEIQRRVLVMTALGAAALGAAAAALLGVLVGLG